MNRKRPAPLEYQAVPERKPWRLRDHLASLSMAFSLVTLAFKITCFLSADREFAKMWHALAVWPCAFGIGCGVAGVLLPGARLQSAIYMLVNAGCAYFVIMDFAKYVLHP